VANGGLSALLLLGFMAHAALGSLLLSGAVGRPCGPAIWIGVGLIAAHLLLSGVASRQMLTDAQRPPSARKKRHLLWKWLSGAALALCCLWHVADSAGAVAGVEGAFIARALLLLAAMAVHALFGVKSLLKDLRLPRSGRMALRLGIVAAALAIAAPLVGLLAAGQLP